MTSSPDRRVALVTGSGKRRVGKVVAEALARRGYDIALHYRSSAEEAEQTAADDINALGTFLCCRRAGLIMAGQPEGGAIVTIGDWAAARPYLDYSAYFASKGAIPAITRDMAVELAARNPRIRVNCILPGPVMLPDDLTDAEVRGAVAGTLLKRPGRPENVAQAVLFLIEDDYVTGVCLPVDGGRTIAG